MALGVPARPAGWSFGADINAVHRQAFGVDRSRAGRGCLPGRRGRPASRAGGGGPPRPDGGDRWYERDLGDGLWLAEEQGALSLWRRVPVPGPVPGGDTVEQDGQVLPCVDRGTGRYEGAAPVRGRLEYAEFRAGGRHVAYERFGDGPVLIGTRLPGTPRWERDDGVG